MCQKKEKSIPCRGINPPAKREINFDTSPRNWTQSYLLIIKYTVLGKRPSDVFRDT